MTERFEKTLQAAGVGSEEALREFYQLFFEQEFFVPRRNQEKPLSDAPKYPNPLLDILGVQADERVIVPFFTRAELVKEWSGVELNARKMNGAALVELMPEEWWLSLNPGSEEGKDFSPWEIARLQEGEKAIPEIVEDHLSEQTSDTVSLHPVPKGELVTQKRALLELGESTESVQSVWLVAEGDQQQTEQSFDSFIIGFQIEKEDSELKEELRAAAKSLFIGHNSVKIFCSSKDSQSLELSLLKHMPPLYERPERPILKRLASLFRLNR